MAVRMHDLYFVIHDQHQLWRESHGYLLNNEIIDLLRNRLPRDQKNFVEVHIKKRLPEIPPEIRCQRSSMSDISFRQFKMGYSTGPCEICGFDRAPNIAHIIPRCVGGPDDDWNLVHLCANHHYLFDRGQLTRDEFEAIDWESKGAEACYYAQKVRRPQHERNWRCSE